MKYIISILAVFALFAVVVSLSSSKALATGFGCNTGYFYSWRVGSCLHDDNNGTITSDAYITHGSESCGFMGNFNIGLRDDTAGWTQFVNQGCSTSWNNQHLYGPQLGEGWDYWHANVTTNFIDYINSPEGYRGWDH